jgi:hypothetical protein
MLKNLKLQHIVDCSNNQAIMDSTKCKLKSCPNRCGWCYILDHIHLMVLPFQMKVWSIVINDDTGSLEVPPDVLVKSFKPARDTQANPMRDNGQKSSSSSNSVATSTPALSVAPPAPSVAPMQYPVHQMMPQPYPYPYGAPAPYTQLRDTPSRRNDVRSSSIISGSDGVEKLVRYIGWLAQKNPTLATTLFEAKETLIERNFSFDTMEHITDDEFLKMGIFEGIKVLLSTQTKRFKKAEARGTP